MTIVNTHEAKTHLSELLRRAAAGEEIVIARGGTPVARLVSVEEPPGGVPPPKPKRKLGTMKKAVSFQPGWDDPMTEDELREWYGGPAFPDPVHRGRPSRTRAGIR